MQDQMKQLYFKEVEGTKDLYSRIGYSIRFYFWDQINEIFSSPTNSSQDCINAYDTLIELVNGFIDSCKDPSSAEHVNSIIFDRNNFTRNFECCPDQLAKYLKSCFEKEREILKECNPVAMQTDNDIHPHQNCSEQQQAQLKAVNNDRRSPSGMEWKSYEESVDCVQKSHQGYQAAEEMLGSLLMDLNSDIQKLQKSFEEKDGHFRFIQLQNLLQKLKILKDFYLEHQAQVEVKLSPKNNLKKELMSIFDRFTKFLTEIYKASPFDEQLKAVLKEYISMILLVAEHPKGCIQIENEEQRDKTGNAKGKGRKSKGKGTDKGEEEVKKFCTKPQQFISSTLLILGFEQLRPFEIKHQSIKMIKEDGNVCECELIIPENDTVGPDLCYQEIKIKHYKREKSTYVNHQYCRVLFQFSVSCFGREWTMEAKSLPFFWYSGSGQLLELTGTRMWLCGSNRGKMYSDCKLQFQLHEDQVCQILNDRVKSIGNGRNRPLSDKDLTFLMDMISRREGDDPKMISLNSFVKDKRNGKNVKDPFFTWFYAFVNTLEKDLLEHWNKRTIFGLVTDDEAKEILNVKRCKTALIRPRRTCVVKPCSLDEARVNIVANIKLEKEVVSIAMDMDFLKNNNGLYEALKYIVAKNGTVVINYLLTDSGIYSLECLKKNVEEENDETCDNIMTKDDYTVTKRMEQLTLPLDEPSDHQHIDTNVFNPGPNLSSKKRKLSPLSPESDYSSSSSLPPPTPTEANPGTPTAVPSSCGVEINGHSGISSDDDSTDCTYLSDDINSNDGNECSGYNSTAGDPFLSESLLDADSGEPSSLYSFPEEFSFKIDYRL